MKIRTGQVRGGGENKIESVWKLNHQSHLKIGLFREKCAAVWCWKLDFVKYDEWSAWWNIYKDAQSYTLDTLEKAPKQTKFTVKYCNVWWSHYRLEDHNSSDRFESRKNLNIVKRRDRDQLRNDRGLRRGELMKIIGEKLAGFKQNE